MKFLDSTTRINKNQQISHRAVCGPQTVNQVHSRPISLGTNPSWYQVVRGSLKVPQNSVLQRMRLLPGK